MREDPTELTGLDLLEKLLDLEENIPDRTQWSPDHSRHSLPQRVHLQQLAVLSAVFIPELAGRSLKERLENILHGDFFDYRAEETYRPLLADIAERSREDRSSTSASRHDNRERGHDFSSLSFCYRLLVRFKKQVELVKSFNQGMLEVNRDMLYAYRQISLVGESIDLTEINRLLWTMIDPEQRVFSKAALIRDHGYPAEDLFDLYLDWF